MRLNRLTKEGVQLVANDALIVVVVALVFIGAAAVAQWEPLDILKNFTPLLLGLFSIYVTITSVILNIRESRKLATRERNDAVRPILIVHGADSYTYPNAIETECYVASPQPTQSINIGIENAGIGVAFDVRIYLRCCDFSFPLVAYPIKSIRAGQTVGVVIRASLSDDLDGFIIKYKDVYQNDHFVDAGYDPTPKNNADSKIYYCTYHEYRGVEKEELDRVLKSSPRSRDSFKRIEAWEAELD